jgi:hypothetical protein
MGARILLLFSLAVEVLNMRLRRRAAPVRLQNQPCPEAAKTAD